MPPALSVPPVPLLVPPQVPEPDHQPPAVRR